jgi:sigma-E factor negative regulatory protein RseA
MSDQIREQVSAFLDGELPNSETDLLLKRMVRDADLRERFGAYALIGEACRSERNSPLARDLCARVNRALDGEAPAAIPAPVPATAHWSRPLAGAALAAGVAVVAVFALQHREIAPQGVVAVNVPMTPDAAAAQPAAVVGKAPVLAAAEGVRDKNLSPFGDPAAPRSLAPARVASYVFAHGQVSPLLTQRDVFTDMIVDGGGQATPVAVESAR